MNILFHSTNRRDAMLQSMFKNAPIGILMLDRQGVILGANPCASTLLSYQNEELAGKHLNDLMPDHQNQNNDPKKGYFTTSVVRQMTGRKDLFALRKDGKKISLTIELSETTMAGDDIGIAFLGNISWEQTTLNSLTEKKGLDV